jgi:hypothetical protein
VRTKLPKLAALLDEAEEDDFAYMSFPNEHRAKIHRGSPREVASRHEPGENSNGTSGGRSLRHQQQFGALYHESQGRPGKPIRLMVGLT